MKHLRITFVLFTSLLLSVPVSAQEKINKFPLHHPESVATDGEYYYISDLGKELSPRAKDGDGCIWKIKISGTITGDSIFAGGLNAPKGTVIIKETLFTTDVDRIVAFDVPSGKKKYEIDMSSVKTSFLNDIAVKDDSTLFISASDISKIFIIHLSDIPSFEELVLTDSIHGPNGLIFDKKHNRLYACGFGTNNQPNGEVGYIDIEKKTFTKIIDRLGYYDGIALLNDNNIIVTDWVAFEKKGLIMKINPDNKNIENINSIPVAGPADFMLTDKNEIIIPEMIDGNILKFKAVQ
jgi:sugar lactone lactonase YvrE